MASSGNEHCANCIGTLSFRIIFKGHVIANGYAIGRVRPPVHLFPLYLLNELTRGLDFCITIARQGQWSDDRARGGGRRWSGAYAPSRGAWVEPPKAPRS